MNSVRNYGDDGDDYGDCDAADDAADGYDSRLPHRHRLCRHHADALYAYHRREHRHYVISLISDPSCR